MCSNFSFSFFFLYKINLSPIKLLFFLIGPTIFEITRVKIIQNDSDPEAEPVRQVEKCAAAYCTILFEMIQSLHPQWSAKATMAISHANSAGTNPVIGNSLDYSSINLVIKVLKEGTDADGEAISKPPSSNPVNRSAAPTPISGPRPCVLKIGCEFFPAMQVEKPKEEEDAEVKKKEVPKKPAAAADAKKKK